MPRSLKIARVIGSFSLVAVVAMVAAAETAKAQQAPAARPATPSQAYYRPPAAAAPQPTAYSAPRPAQPPTYYYAAGDPYGFTGWLNATRARYGLSAVGHDPNLSAWAAQNNVQQRARGMGHYVMGPSRRQNSATGHYAQIGAMWLASPPHRAALLDPTIRWVGIAGFGAYWTFNAN